MIVWFPLSLGLIGAYIGLRADLRRRKLLLTRSAGWSLLSILDVGCVAVCIGGATALLVVSPHLYSRPDSLFSPATLGAIGCALSLLFLWPEGRRQVQLQRPAGIVFPGGAIFFGIFQILAAFTFHEFVLGLGLSSLASVVIGLILPVTVGCLLLALIVPPFIKGHEEHRILDRIAAQGQFVQSEWVQPTLEC